VTAEPRVLSGRYRVDELIGRGGMATVFRGYDLTLGRPVAIKLLNRDLANDNAFRTRFRLDRTGTPGVGRPGSRRPAVLRRRRRVRPGNRHVAAAPNTIISVPVHVAVASVSSIGPDAIDRQVSLAGS